MNELTTNHLMKGTRIHNLVCLSSSINIYLIIDQSIDCVTNYLIYLWTPYKQNIYLFFFIINIFQSMDFEGFLLISMCACCAEARRASITCDCCMEGRALGWCAEAGGWSPTSSAQELIASRTRADIGQTKSKQN